MTAWERAVEAMTTLWPKGNPTPIEATALLTAALPAIRRMLAEELRAENRRLDDGESLSTFAAWELAANHLTRKEVMG